MSLLNPSSASAGLKHNITEIGNIVSMILLNPSSASAGLKLQKGIRRVNKTLLLNPSSASAGLKRFEPEG